MTGGFGWSFYGFFVFAVVWIAAYFAWAAWMNRRPGAGGRRPEAGGGKDHGMTTEGGHGNRFGQPDAGSRQP